MSKIATLRLEEGDELRFCSNCAFSRACLAEGMDKPALAELHVLVQHVGPLPPGTHVFREGEPFTAIAAVRSGSVKTWRVDIEGREQVLGFHFPGEVIGLSAIDAARYPCSAVTLETTELCRFSFERMATLAARVPGLQRELFRMMSRDIGHAESLAADHPADARLAAFLVGLRRRLQSGEGGSDAIELVMSRTDIASYLRLVPETVSRLLRRFQDQGWIRVRGRRLVFEDAAALARVAAPVRRN